MISLRFEALNGSIFDLPPLTQKNDPSLRPSRLASFFRFKELFDALCDLRREQRRDGVPDLLRNLNLVAKKVEIVRKALEPSGLSMRDRPVLGWMEVTSLLGFEKFRADCIGWSIPPEPSKEIRSTACLSNPTRRRQFRYTPLQVKSVHSFLRYRPVSL